MAENLALSIDYSDSIANVRSDGIIAGPYPASDMGVDGRTDGVWIELSTPEGEVVFRRSLPSPRRPRETYAPDGTLSVVKGETTTSNRTVAVPWLGPDARLQVLAGRQDSPDSPVLGAAEEATKILSVRLGEIAERIDPSRVELDAGFNFPVSDEPFGKAHGGEIRLVFLPDGFALNELPIFHAAVTAFLHDFALTPPFSAMLDAFSACHVDVPSKASGILDPAAPGNGSKPFFSARFGEGQLRRCIEVDQPLAQRIVSALGGSQPHKVGIVVANTAEYGGSGGDVAVYSRDVRSTAIAIHELGHTIFNLADEYSDAGQAGSLSPIEVNVAAKPDPGHSAWADGEPQRLKWAAHLSPGMQYPSSATTDADAVGAFQGAKYQPLRYYRPSAGCKMRTLDANFCPVCDAHIRARLAGHLPS